MPRIIDPGQINVGTGLAANESIETNAFVNPTGGNEGLRVHIVDPSRAHQARAISLEDVGGYYSSDHVEGALQELAGSGAAGRSNGLVSGGTFTSVGLTLTLDPTFAFISGTLLDYTGDSVVLTDNTTNYVYIDPGTNLLTASTVLPALSIDPCHIAEVVTTAGSVTGSTDARFFAFNLDRKVPFTVREGSSFDARSEGAFITFEAALWHLTNYAATGAGQIEKHRIIVRGEINLATGAVLPAIDGIIIEGEGDAGFVLAAGSAALSITGNEAEIRNLYFVTDVASASAVQVVSAENAVIDNCEVRDTGSQSWRFGFTGVGDTPGGRVTNCIVNTVDYGIQIGSPVTDWLVENCVFDGSGTVGIQLETGIPVSAEGFGTIRNCRINGYDTGVIFRGTNYTLLDTEITGAITGVSYPFPSTGTDGNFLMDGCRIVLDAATGEDGVFYDASYGKIVNCDIINPRTVWGAEIPVGIQHADAGGALTIENTRVEGFYNTASGVGTAIELRSPKSSVLGCQIVNGVGVQVTGSATGVRIADTDIDEAFVGISCAEPELSVSNCRITLDATVGTTGIFTAGSDNTRIANTKVETLRANGSYTGEFINGIYLQGDNSQIVNCDIINFYNSADGNGSGILLSGTGTRNIVTGCNITTALTGITLNSNQVASQINGVVITGVATGIECNADEVLISDCNIQLDSTIGLIGFDLQGTECRVSDSRAILNRTWVAEVDVPLGVNITGIRTHISNVTVDGFDNDGASPGGAGIFMAAATDGSVIKGCEIVNCYNGVEVTDGADSWSVSDTVMAQLSAGGIIGLGAHDAVRINGNTIFADDASPGITLSDGSSNNTITGNTINGGTYGILLTGTDGAASRSRRIDISSNLIYESVTAGISIEGWVQQGTITGNTVDCFSPAAGFNQTADACIRLLTTGTDSQVRNWSVTGNICSRAQNGIIVRGVSQATEDTAGYITISGNTVTYCGYAQDLSGGVPDTFEGVGGKGIGVEFGEDVQISGNSVNNIGHLLDNTNTLDFPDQGAPTEDVSAVGIYSRNSASVTVANNNIRDVVSENLGLNYGLYFHAGNMPSSSQTFTGYSVTGNTIRSTLGVPGNGDQIHAILFRADAGASGFSTAMETIAVSGNTTRRCRLSGLSFQCGDTGDLRNLTVAGNTLRFSNLAAGSFLEAGIQFLVEPGFSNQEITYAKITGNTIAGSSNGSGIAADIQGGSLFRWITISDNTITGLGTSGVRVEVDSASSVNLTDLIIDQNTVEAHGSNGSGYGIRVASASGNTMERVTITNNHMASDESPDENIHVFGDDTDLLEIRVHDNTVNNQFGGGAPGNSGIKLETTATGQATGRRLSICGNNLRTSAIGIDVIFEGFVDQMTMANNIVETDSQGFRFRAQSPVALVSQAVVDDILINANSFTCGGATYSNNFNIDDGFKVHNLRITDNSFRECDIGLNITVEQATLGTDPSAYMWQISGNNFEDCESEGLVIDIGEGLQSDQAVNLNIESNTFNACASVNGSAGLRAEIFALPQNLNINHNSFFNCGTNVDSLTEGTLELRLGGATCRNINVVGNSIEGSDSNGILLEEVSGASSVFTNQLQISDNQITLQGGDGLRLDLAAFAGLENVSVCRNNINNTGGTLTRWGISMALPTTSETNGLRIDNNILVDVGDSATSSGGIQLVVTDEIENLSVSHNQIHDADYRGIDISFDGDANTINVDGNVISDVDDIGIRVEHTGADGGSELTNLSVSDNNINDNRPSNLMTEGILVQLDDVVADPDSNVLSVSNNRVQGFTSDGIIIDSSSAADSGNFVSTVVNDNVVVGPGNLSSGNSIRVQANGGSIQTISISGNSCRDAGGHSIVMNGFDGSMRNVNISNNSIYDWGQFASAQNYSGIFFQTTSGATRVWRGWVVSGNSIITTGAGAGVTPVGINMTGAADAEMRNLNFSDNSMYLDNIAGSRGFFISIGVGVGTQNNLIFTGNNIRNAAADAFDRSSTNFDPSSAWIMSNNVYDGGGNNWASAVSGSGLGAYSNPPVANGNNNT